MQSNDFQDARNLVQSLLRNNEVLTQAEVHFRDSIAGLPNYKRRLIYHYVAALKERIRLCTESIEELHRDAMDSADAIAEARRLLNELRGQLNDQRETRNDDKTTLDATPGE